MPTGLNQDVYYIILSEQTPLNSVYVINVSNAILINRKRISMYQALFLRAGYKTRLHGTLRWDYLES